MQKYIVNCKQRHLLHCRLLQSSAIRLCSVDDSKIYIFLEIKINLQIHVTSRYFTFAVISSRKIYYAFQIRSTILYE